MTSHLTSLSVLVTRPGEAGMALCRAIDAEGGHGIYCPTIAFTELKNELTQLKEQDWFIFVSPQAVRSIVEPFKTFREAKVKLAAVGEGTAKALNELGFAPVLSPKAPFGSEALLALPEFQLVAGQRITIVCGEGGRQTLSESLKARGALVTQLITYRRIIPNLDVTPFIRLLKKGEIHALVTTSYDGVQNLKKIMGDEGWPSLRSLPLIVVSERIKILAHHLGFQTILVANHAGHEAILEKLSHIREGKNDG